MDTATPTRLLPSLPTPSENEDLQGANWIGVLCEEGKVCGLKLENMGLSGAIDVESLTELPAFRTISLMNNDFDEDYRV
ncbi:actin-regulating kinase prk1 [Sarracenia purpurea var. burkii]